MILRVFLCCASYSNIPWRGKVSAYGCKIPMLVTLLTLLAAGQEPEELWFDSCHGSTPKF
jgi:hypothetical protein